MKQTLQILGIDPGTNVMGYGVLEVKEKKPSIVSSGILRLSQYTDHYSKLGKIHERVNHLIKQYGVDVLAIEAPFYDKNVQSMLKLGRAQGAAMLAAVANDIPIREYSPLKVKQSITGSGRASKEQVAYMLEQQFSVKIETAFLDATDALAVAFCFHLEDLRGAQKSRPTSWKDFIKKNEKRIIQ